MAELVYNCPRCNARKVTFNVLAAVIVGVHYSWQQQIETFCVCRHCNKSTVVVMHDKETAAIEYVKKNGGFGNVQLNLNEMFEVDGYISLKDRAGASPPDHLPDAIRAVFEEASTCMAVGCFNAAGTMFRLCIDLATKSFLPAADTPGINSKVRRNLGLRLPWLFEHGHLPRSLEDLASCVKEDGNDGAHEGTLQTADVEDLLDFTVALLERLYTEPARLRAATERRASRRQPTSDGRTLVR